MNKLDFLVGAILPEQDILSDESLYLHKDKSVSIKFKTFRYVVIRLNEDYKQNEELIKYVSVLEKDKNSMDWYFVSKHDKDIYNPLTIEIETTSRIINIDCYSFQVSI